MEIVCLSGIGESWRLKCCETERVTVRCYGAAQENVDNRAE